MAHVESFLQQLLTKKLLIGCEFILGPDLVPDGKGLEEDDYAHLFGQASLVMAKFRMIRNLWFFSWPADMFNVLHVTDNKVGKDTVALFRKDWDVWTDLKNLGGPTPGEHDLQKRHVMNMTANVQYQEAFATDGWDPRVVVKIADTRINACNQTQIAEDLNGAMAVHGKGRQGRQWKKKPEALMASCITGDIVSGKHKYASIDTMTPMASPAVALPRDSFEVDEHMRQWTLRTSLGRAERQRGIRHRLSIPR